jgi:hypothetical protein
LLAHLHVGPPSSGQEPPSGSVYSCDLPWDHQNRRTASITHGAAKEIGFNLAADRRLGCIAWFAATTTPA